MYKQVIIIDDCGDLRDLYPDVFADERICVQCFANEAEAFRVLLDIEPSFILLGNSIEKPEVLGFITEVRKLPRFRDIPIAILTSQYELDSLGKGLPDIELFEKISALSIAARENNFSIVNRVKELLHLTEMDPYLLVENLSADEKNKTIDLPLPVVKIPLSS